MSTSTVDSPAAIGPYRANPVFWIMWLLPAAAVIGGFATLFIAVRGADRALPPGYHWEGEHLDRDFDRARLAAAHGIAVSIEWQAGECTATVRHAPDDPATLTLLFANGADASLDRVILLRRAQPGLYRGACAPLVAGRWRVALENTAGDWAIRTRVTGAPARVEMRARDPGGAP
jgi:uncharacterized protein